MKMFKRILAFVLVFCMVAGLMPGMAEVQAATAKPADGTTTSQPFNSGTGGSSLFRIPAMVTTKDGTIVAAADARWNNAADAGGIDTMVSYSKDQGATWNYSFANYLGDNDKVFNRSCATFIDPVLTYDEDSNTIYMVVDLYVGGYAINTAPNKPRTGSGFTSEGYLKIKKSGEGSYNYYVKGTAIYNTSGAAVSDYTVDEYFNLKDASGTIVGNLFYSDSAYQAYPTTYLYMTKSTDNGKSWSAPQLLKNVKKDTEYFYGVGPGNGIVTKDGTIMIPCYVYGGSTDSQKASFIYSTDNGATWNRTADATSSWSSESQLVELSDGTIRMFFRNGNSKISYVDAAGNGKEGYTWGNVVTTSISNNSNCQISAMKYSEKINGKEAILLSCPTNTSSRKAGKIYVALVNDDKTLDFNTFAATSVTTGTYQYSCLTELRDGSVGLLYENGDASIVYTSYPIGTLAKDAQIGEPLVEPGFVDSANNEVTKLTFASKDAAAQTVIFKGLSDGHSIAVASENTSVATVTADGNNITVTPVEAGTTKVKATVQSASRATEVGDEYTLDVTVNEVTEVEPNTVDVVLIKGQSTVITDETGNYENTYTGAGLDTDIAEVVVIGQDVTTGTETTVVKKNSIAAGNTIIIGDGSGNYIKRNGTGIQNTTNPEEATVWTVGSGYTLKDGDYYLRPRSGSWSVSLNVNTSSNYNQWSYGSSGFYYDGTLGNYYLKYDGGWSVESGSSQSNGVAYELKTESINRPASTTIEITGKSEGSTSVKVGNTIYNITVNKAPDFVTIDNSPFTSGTGSYKNRVVTKLTITTTQSYDLNLNSSVQSGGTWSSADTSIATVDANGKVTGVGEGATSVTYTVNGMSYTIPVVVLVMPDAGSNIFDFYIDEITNSTVAYSVNATNELLYAQEGEAIYLGFNKNTSINFFGKEDEGYALTYMSASSNGGHYYKLDKVDKLSDLGDAYTNTAIQNAISQMDSGVMESILWKVINDGYHGTMGWSRKSSTSGVNSALTFRSQKLPTVTKEIVSVDGKAYTEGMSVSAGDKIVYKVNVKQYATTEAIKYDNDTLTDNLSGAKFTKYNSNNVTGMLSDSAMSSDKVYSYDVEYTITDDDLDTMITNTVDLTYTYTAGYSSGSFGGSANAAAKVNAIVFEPKDIVIDFGLPVVIDYSGSDAHGRYNLVSGTAKYGKVTVINNKVTYTPDSILLGVDTVTLVNEKGGEAAFKVYPATTMYYEEGFATFSNALGATTGWSGGSKGTGSQETEVLGQKSKAFGYTDKYAEETGKSNGSEAKSEAVSDDATFTFTGTGVDIYANCTTTTGRVSIMIRDSASGALKKLLMVETQTGNGGDATTGQVVDSASLPIVSVDLGAHGTYDVTIRHSKSSADETTLRPVKLDGYRVYNTLADSSVFVNNKEDNPEFYQLRDMVLKALSVESVADSEYGSVRDMAEQVYAGISADSEQPAAVLSNNDVDVQDLLDNGPKNELFLRAGETLVFNVTTSRVLQLGMKAPAGETSYKVTGATNTVKTGTITTSTDMFYDLGNAVGTEKEYTITITNTGSNILSITDLKICDDPNATFTTLSVDDIELALNVMGYGDEPEYADATLNIVLDNANGNTLATTALTANGVVGEANTFSAAAIEEAVAALVPEGYELKDAAYADQEVAYGEEATVTFTAEEIEVDEPETEEKPETGTSIIGTIVTVIKNVLGKLFSWF